MLLEWRWETSHDQSEANREGPGGRGRGRLLTPAELAEVQGEEPLRTAYADLWTAHQQVR